MAYYNEIAYHSEVAYESEVAYDSEMAYLSKILQRSDYSETITANQTEGGIVTLVCIYLGKLNISLIY